MDFQRTVWVQIKGGKGECCWVGRHEAHHGPGKSQMNPEHNPCPQASRDPA